MVKILDNSTKSKTDSINRKLDSSKKENKKHVKRRSRREGGKRIITKDGKVELHVLIPEDLYRQLVEIAPLYYGKGRGGMSYIVEEALRQFLTPRLHTQTYTQTVSRINPKGSIRSVYYRVKEKIKEIMGFVPFEVPEKTLTIAISEVRGSDPRTIEKWLNIFEKSGLIKYVSGFKPNRVFELIG